jgi:mRNA-degrading endonuclease RelE of RelBE toxin-antitoxin system
MKPHSGWRIELSPGAEQGLASLPQIVQDGVLDALHDLEDDPTPPDSLAMRGKGQGLRRIRIDDYRVV